MTGSGAPTADLSALGTDEAFGQDARARTINEVLRSISRAARAFTLYDPKNAIMLRFLADYRAATESALKLGAFTLTIAPWEFLLGSEVVYREKDREKSLSFRLFRDGVRSLTLNPGFTWEEGVKLLEAVSLRFTGQRQREDDAVTLLRKAAFTHLTFSAVEGFVPAEEQPEAIKAPVVGFFQTQVKVQAPPDFDLPLDPAPAIAVSHREVPERYLSALRNEEAASSVRHAAVRVTGELLIAANGPASELSNAELLALVTEVRDACLIEGAADELLALVQVVRAQHGIGHDAFKPLVDAIGTPQNLERLLEGIPPDATAPSPALLELLLEVPGDFVAALGARLKATEDPAQQRLLEEFLITLARERPERVLPSIPSLDPRTAAKVTGAMVNADPERGIAIAERLAQGAETSGHLEALELLAHAPRSDRQFALLTQFLLSPNDAIFTKAAQALGLSKDSRGYDLVVKQCDLRASADTFTRDSATAAGEAMMTLMPVRALPLARQWANPKTSFLSRMASSPHERWLQVVAISALGLVGGLDAENEIRAIQEHTSDESLRKHCIQTIMRRRRNTGAARHG